MIFKVRLGVGDGFQSRLSKPRSSSTSEGVGGELLFLIVWLLFFMTTYYGKTRLPGTRFLCYQQRSRQEL